MKKIIILILIMFLTGCGYNQYKIPDDVIINLNNNIFEVYDQVSSINLVNNSNIEIIEKELNTEKIGKQTFTLEFFYQKRLYKKEIEYEVKDTTPPVFINSSSNISILLNDKNSLCSKISFGDNYDETPSCEVLGEFDVEKLGNYQDLEFVIKDNSFNEARKKFNLYVLEKNKTTTTKPNYIKIDKIIKEYKNDNTEIGIDISKWQGKIDFSKVKNAGIEFVIMRIGVQKNKGKEIEIDPYFSEYLKGAKEVGLKIGVYIYNVATSIDEGKKTALWVINELKGEKLDFPIAYDWENWSSFNNYQISLHTLSDAYLSFEKTIEEHGYKAMLYSSKYYLENVWMNYDNSNIWLAHYTDKTNYQGNYLLWQVTSLLKIDGINENSVDLDIYYK